MIQQNTQQNQLKQKQTKLNYDQTEKTFLDHIHEVRSRLFWVVAVLILTSAAGFQIKDQLIAVVMAPLHGEKLIYLTPGGGFSFIFTVCIYFGALITVPFGVYHLYKFLQPLIRQASRKFIVTFVLISTMLAVAGATFGYFLAIPAAINFLTTFAGDAVTPNLTADSYLSFVVVYMLGLAVLFQLPLLLFLIDHIRPFPPGTLSSTQRFVIIGATIIAAVITPTPDVINMMTIAIPVIIMYELGAFTIFLRRRKSHKASRRPAIAAVSKDASAEPLTAIVEEMNDERILTARQPVVTPVISVTIPVQQPAAKTQKRGYYRTMDGMVITRPAPVIAKTPPRSESIRIVPQRANVRTQRRSLDGFSLT